ncbi:hypothetical protein [Stieleria varia]|uniref:Uncharacterized protein n=1 Tax=Stieleria varia TaxID=2528005 RepID=A0A5C6A568_9BACT|nr:hypothetical protein [Stieleria varia]TWT94619.1 hypothetical protein Pla52n_54400 [Stieleria varia]
MYEDEIKFDQFLFEMDDVLDVFIADAESEGVHLDYSLESLAGVEQILLSDASDDLTLENRAARYVGEVFRRFAGGTWCLCQKGPKYLFDNLPVIEGHSSSPVEFCPISLVRLFKIRKRCGMIQKAIESNANSSSS